MTGAPAEPTRALLDLAWASLGGAPELPHHVRTTGDPAGLLPSTQPALPAMVAAVGASTLAAAVLDAARCGSAVPPVDLDVEHVAMAARSERYARRGGTAATDLFAPLSRFWATGDGWLRLHANYAWHQERALQVLGCADDPDAVAAAVRTWRGADLEDALADAGGLGAAVRTRAEWLAHPQSRAVAARPLARACPGTGAARPLGPGRAAEGVRVLDLTRVIAGPVATRTLAAWGAQVLRLDSPRLPELPAHAVDTLPGKASATLDLADTVRLERLLAAADVVVQGYRPGALARFGLDAGSLAVRHPHLIVATLSAWGPTGPWAGRRGFDSLVQCATGIADAEGSAGAPGVLPAQVLDHATGYLAAAAILLALAGSVRGEPARSVELSLASTAHWLTGTPGGGSTGAERPLAPDQHLISLSGAAQEVQVIAPPGHVGDLRPVWTGTTDLGADPAEFPVGCARFAGAIP
ncbi:CoA-transferase family III [Modestobacter sp. DSM 44400]|uniref:CoA transferase n=1 Tax=Modestobacter sp. DSM 44400 TaxID=1550230 RepID=UPI0008953327|nr:CoA transferase [Modestobacter sp. DSM 44400]SDY32575.1 CoA-transferase family III [Modestobacter sp. DSM 44400]